MTNADPQSQAALSRTLKKALVCVRVIIAVCFTVGGLSFAGIELATQAFSPFLRGMLAAQENAASKPGNTDLQLQAELAKHYFDVSRRGERFAQNATLLMAFMLCGVGLGAVFAGDRLKAALRIVHESQPKSPTMR